MGSPVIWNGRTGKNLSPDGMKAKNGRQELYLEVDPRTTATAGNQGDFLSSIYGKFQKLDSGTTTNWRRIDVEFSPYKVYDNFESNNGDGFVDPKWVAYGNTNSALSYPDNFGGAAGPTSGTTSANTALSGNFVLRLTVSNLMNGKGTYRAFSISNGEKGLPFIFESQINITKLGSAEWVSNAQIWVVGSNDNFVSNFQNIPLTNSVVSRSGLLKGSFVDPTATLTNFRLCIHFSGLTDTFNVDFDEIKIYSGSQDTLSSIVSEWFSYTPTFQGVGTPTNIKMKWRQVGSCYEIEGSFVTGAIPSSTQFRMSTPNGVLSSLDDVQVIGMGARSSVANNDHAYAIQSSLSNYLTMSLLYTAGYDPTLPLNSDLMFGASQKVSIFAKLPVQGLNQFGSSVVASGENDLDFRVRKTSTQSVSNTTWTEVVFNSISKGNPSLIDLVNGRLTLKPNARYAVSFNVAIGNVGSLGIELRKNGVQVLGEYYDGQSSTANIERTWIVDTDGNASTDYYSLWFYQSLGSSQTIATASFLNAIRLDKPFSMNLFQASGMVLSPTDNVLPAQFSRSTSQSIPSTANTQIVWDTTNFNPSSVIQLNTTTGRLTNNGPSGYYKFNGMVRSGAFASGNGVVGQIFRSVNGGANVEIVLNCGGASGTCYIGLPFEFTVYLSNGSYVDIFAYQNSGSSNSFYIGQLDVQRVDKTAVSSGGGYTKWQTKTQSTDFTTNGVISNLTFNNLEIGKTYRCNTSFMMDIFNNTAIAIASNHGFSVLAKQYVPNTSTEAIDNCDRSIIFVASATTLTFTSANFSSTAYLRGGSSVTLEELPQHISTTQWT